MAAFCIPVGFWKMNIPGAVAGAAASLIEKIEYGRIDDNITVPLVTFGCLQAFRFLGVYV